MSRPALMSLANAILGAALLAPLGATGAQQPYELKLAGACDTRLHLDGLSFKLQGSTANGSPYWRAISSVGNSAVYIYYDADCDGSKDGTPRWIIDTDKPSLTATKDLDGDMKCEYLARINSEDPTSPPVEGEWHMECGVGQGKDWRDHYLILLRHSTTMTATSTNTMSTTATETEAHSHEEDAGAGEAHEPSTSSDPAKVAEVKAAPKAIRLQGACEHKGYLNDLEFTLLGRTADGSPYYKANTASEYLYFDTDCDGPGGSDAAPKWVLDRDAPNLQRLSDLDGDGRCDYHARLDVGAADPHQGPPARATWRMYCGPGTKWQDVVVFLSKHRGAAATPAPSTTLGSRAPAAMVSGAARHGIALAAAAAAILGVRAA